MKKTDVAMIIFIAGLSVMVAFLIGRNIPFLQISEKGESVPTIEVISSTVTQPDPRVFGGDAINPTVETVVGK